MASGTYDPTLAAALDRVRFAVGDTDVEDDAAIKPDEEYLAVIAAQETETGAIAEMARALATQVMQDPDSYSETGGISIKWSERIKTWMAIYENMTARTASVDETGATRSVRPTRHTTTWLAEYRRPEFWTGDTW